mmetsp:Transcript_15648/g.31460  ORF Transcript_15648/g.31460 Transcript_15648/m.31460 type:complete len:224 (+) Transcript_15648:1081-1752(+)
MSAATMHELGSSRWLTIVRMYACSEAAMPGGARTAAAGPVLSRAAPAASPLLLWLLLWSLWPAGLLLLLLLGCCSRIVSSTASRPKMSSISLHATASITAPREPSSSCCADCCSLRRSSLRVETEVLRRIAEVSDSRSALVSGFSFETVESAAAAVRLRRMPGDTRSHGSRCCSLPCSEPVARASGADNSEPGLTLSLTHIEDKSFLTPIPSVAISAQRERGM